MSSTKREPEEELDADSPANKRVKLEANGSADGVKPQIEPEAEAEGADAAVKQEEAEDDGEEEFIPLPQSTTRSAVKRGHECPYLDTILRQNLDFDFEKCCSVSLSPINVYVCLVCGKYFQVRNSSSSNYSRAASPVSLLNSYPMGNY
eukprot:GHUV01012632.1.p2 GENE.GHUV01012632.1~~GHUV01012632.1.p2  ORF type:complete len:148 (+),score=23.95 GHUV01012632.1:356-799(+)